MIRSMTAYARREIKVNGVARLEMRSVNQRYLKLTFVCRNSSVVLNPSCANAFVHA